MVDLRTAPTNIDAGAMFARLVGAATRGETGVQQRGWVVIDGVLGGAWATAMARECDALQSHKLLAPHTFEFAGENNCRQTYEHSGRSFADLDEQRIRPEVAAVAPLLASFAAGHACALADALAGSLPDLGLSCEAGSVQVKLQVTSGEYGCAPCHYDTSDSASSRQLTLLIYLSDGWNDDFGGGLQLMPFLEAPVTVVPQFDRGVLFLSDRLLHRSLQPTGPGIAKARWLLTVWLDGTAVDRQLPGCGRWAPLLQRLVAPAVYAAEYLQALEQSLPPGEARRNLLASQAAEVAALECDEELKEMISELREAAADALVRDVASAPPLKRQRVQPCLPAGEFQVRNS